ncbi:MAG: J domain-containing protein [Kofleriaceae bacterium]|nr:J domain-containing protein [Kofleriaceae bacterium]
MNKAIDVMTWVMRLEATPNASPHEILGLAATASADDIQLAFYNAAKKAHPDRFRAVLSPPQMDRLTRAYSRVTEAYGIVTGRIRRSVAAPSASLATVASRPHATPTSPPRPGATIDAATSPARRAATPTTPAELNAELAQQMNNKALPYFRRAEAAFANNDAKAAGLQLRLAIAADPSSTYLRRVLHELESAAKK